MKELTWRKSARSGGNGGNCVEIAETEADVRMRDSKNPHGGQLAFSREQFAAFTKSVKDGEFDL